VLCFLDIFEVWEALFNDNHVLIVILNGCRLVVVDGMLSYALIPSILDYQVSVQTLLHEWGVVLSFHIFCVALVDPFADVDGSVAHRFVFFIELLLINWVRTLLAQRGLSQILVIST
jgi:hypothetical protein